MSSQSIAFFSAALIASLFSIDANASTDVYTQASNGTFADTSAIKNMSGDPGFTWTLDQDEEAWAYFKVATNVSFNRISWYGSNTDGNFAVDFYSATCGSCGINRVATDGTFTHDGVYGTGMLSGSGPYTQAQVHKTLVSGSIYSYYVDLASTLTLDHNSPYYALSVVNNYSSSPFYWAGSNTGTGPSYHYIVGQAMVLSSPHNLAFTLTDTNVSAVPVPAAAWLLGSGLLGLIGVARRKAA